MSSRFLRSLSLFDDFLGALAAPFLGGLVREELPRRRRRPCRCRCRCRSRDSSVTASAGLLAALPLFYATRCRGLRVLAAPHRPPALVLPSANACSSSSRRPRAESRAGPPISADNPRDRRAGRTVRP